MEAPAPHQPQPFWLEHENFFLVPVCHYRMEFAREVRRSFLALQPDRVAIELPQFMAQPLEQALGRLPRLTTLTYQVSTVTMEISALPQELLENLVLELVSRVDSEDPLDDPFELLAKILSGEVTPSNQNLTPDRIKEQLVEAGRGSERMEQKTMLLPVEPTDPLIEGARSAAEADKPWHCIDLSLKAYGRHNDPIPDSSSLRAIGLGAFWKLWKDGSAPEPDPLDRLREAYMAQNLRMLRSLYPDDKIMVVVGLTHVESLLELLREESQALTAAPSFDPGQVELTQPDLSTIRSFSMEMPWLMALYELERGGAGADDFWRTPADATPAAPPDLREQLEGVKPDQLMASLESMLGLRPRPAPPIPPRQRRAVARYLQGLASEPAALMDLLNQFGAVSPQKVELPPVTPPPGTQAFTFRQVADRRGELLAIYAAAAADAGGAELDRQRALQSLVTQASLHYAENTGDAIAPWQVRVLYQFSRNYASFHGRLLPSLYELLMACRGVADDNFSYEVWDLGSFYPWSPVNDDESDLPILQMDADTLRIAGIEIKQWHFHRKLPRLRHRIPVRQRDRESTPGEWSESFDQGTLCSYPPEDLVIEDYARYLQKKAIQQLSLEKTRVEPFSTSMLDGIDMRETLRNWHERQIYVRESRRVSGGVGAVILIFDEDDASQRYPWKMTWHGEHSQESDMAFFATPVQQKIVGPGIARCEYGGLLMTYPNRRLADVWSDPMYKGCRTKAEVLIMAGLDYGEDRHVVYVAAHPPRSQFRSLAARLGKKLVYLPIGSLSPQSIQRIRVFHVLSGNQVRKFAKDYIW